MTIKLKRWDSAEHLQTDEDIELYLQACFEEAGDDAAFIAKALGNVARARSMTQLAKDTGMGRESLYKALSGEGNPSFGTILKVTNALGLKFNVHLSDDSDRKMA
ncbi:addiction module antidote protein [Methylomonas sp. MED-D]|uniref:addiction module antidote protein n=1 Tax=unclassified Methylomonas TaxID=2608980 RepID=UPI002479BAD8|nr:MULTISPECIES: addiction module antidote protein [unclassified Methylomonas]MDT4329877.1 putative addiction module antidote protein [Methylomonas sp. MV1]WGS87006.1 putative addiction module antidote protein [Methylomonas sp. UP202]